MKNIHTTNGKFAQWLVKPTIPPPLTAILEHTLKAPRSTRKDSMTVMVSIVRRDIPVADRMASSLVKVGPFCTT